METRLIIWGSPSPIDNDDAVKSAQRMWSVQGRLAYEATFDHLDKLGSGGIPSRFFRTVVDAETGELLHSAEYARGGGGAHTRETNLSFNGLIKVLARGGPIDVPHAALKEVKGISSAEGPSITLLIGKRAICGVFDARSSIFKAGDITFQPNDALKKALLKIKA